MRVLLMTEGESPIGLGPHASLLTQGVASLALGKVLLAFQAMQAIKMALPEFTVRLQDGSRTEEIPLFCFFRVQLTRNCALKPFGFLAFLLTLHENPINAWMH